MRDRRLVAILGAGVVAVVTILVIVLLAIEPIPEFAPLEGSGQSGYVAYARDDGEDGGSKYVVDLVTGTDVEVRVSADSELLGWDPDGNLLVVAWGPGPGRAYAVDPATGEALGEMTPEIAHEMLPDSSVRVDHDAGLLVLRRIADGQTASFSAPGSYEAHNATAMGADRVVFVDELGRVAVAEVGDEVTPVLVADDGSGWQQVVGRD